MAYRDKALQRKTTAERVRRYREKRKALQGVTSGVVAPLDPVRPIPDEATLAFSPAPKPDKKWGHRA